MHAVTKGELYAHKHLLAVADLASARPRWRFVCWLGSPSHTFLRSARGIDMSGLQKPTCCKLGCIRAARPAGHRRRRWRTCSAWSRRCSFHRRRSPQWGMAAAARRSGRRLRRGSSQADRLFHAEQPAQTLRAVHRARQILLMVDVPRSRVDEIERACGPCIPKPISRCRAEHPASLSRGRGSATPVRGGSLELRMHLPTGSPPADCPPRRSRVCRRRGCDGAGVELGGGRRQ